METSRLILSPKVFLQKIAVQYVPNKIKPRQGFLLSQFYFIGYILYNVQTERGHLSKSYD